MKFPEQNLKRNMIKYVNKSKHLIIAEVIKYDMYQYNICISYLYIYQNTVYNIK